MFKIFFNHSRMMLKFQQYLLSFSILVQKMVTVSIGRTKIQILYACGRGMNKLFPPKYYFLLYRLKKLCIWVKLPFPLFRIRNVYFFKGLSTQVSSLIAGSKKMLMKNIFTKSAILFENLKLS